MARSFALFARNQEDFTSRIMKNLLAAHELDEEIHSAVNNNVPPPPTAPKRPTTANSTASKRRGRSASKIKSNPTENSKQQLGSRYGSTYPFCSSSCDSF